MKDITNNYLTIQGWMSQVLNLKGNELLAFALIFGFCQDEDSEFTGSLKYVMTWLNCSKPTALKALDNLIKKDLIVKEQEFRNNQTFNHYKVNFSEVKRNFTGGKETLLGVKKLYGGSQETLLGEGKETLLGGSQETLPNKDILEKDKKDKDNNTYRAFAHLSISFDEFNNLIQLGYSEDQVNDILDEIENYKKNKNYKSLFLTAKSWLKRESGNMRSSSTGPIKNQSVYNRHNPNPAWEYGVDASTYPENEREAYYDWIDMIHDESLKKSMRERGQA